MTCVEKRRIFLGVVVVCSLGGESWDEEEEGERGEGRVGMRKKKEKEGRGWSAEW
jgi:hypothetical protein